MMSHTSYTNWKPLVLEQISVEALRSPDYRRFILDASIVPGCRLLLARHRLRPDWPYVETKFNPNTGMNLPPEKYEIAHVWFLGRGSEALDDHLRVLDRVESFLPAERSEIREVFGVWIANMTRDLIALADRYQGRIPFRINRKLEAVDTQGKPVAVNPACCGAGDVFAVKGLLSSADPSVLARIPELLRRCVAHLHENRYEVEQTTPPPGRGHGPRMLMQGVGACFFHKSKDVAVQDEAMDEAADFLGEVLDGHYNPETGLFSEYIDLKTGARSTLLDPGHANELVGLGLGLIECLEQSAAHAKRHAALITRAKRDLPRMLVKSTTLGYNPRHPGIYKAVDNRTGATIDSGMPWWNLPETMRAAVRAYAVTDDRALRQQCLEAFRLCHNAYFSRYLNRNNSLFPFQTLDGNTGKVVDVVPAVPEGDPLYHANGAFLDMLTVIEQL